MKRKNTHAYFDRIAGHYDLLNHVLSLSIDKWWRNVLVRLLAPAGGELILDGCAGTCDVALAIARSAPGVRVVGVDLSSEMIRLGRRKLEEAGIDGSVELIEGDMLDLPFPDDTFDALTVGFGLRNLSDYAGGIAEMRRVLKPGGRLLILEFGPPMPGIGWAWYRWYLRRAVPLIGGMISGKYKQYSYLARSIGDFLGERDVTALLEGAGLEEISAWKLTGGISFLYAARKPGVHAASGVCAGASSQGGAVPRGSRAPRSTR